MACDLNLGLDNMDLGPGNMDVDVSDSFPDVNSLVYPSAEDIPEDSIEMDILNIISHYDGVSMLLSMSAIM